MSMQRRRKYTSPDNDPVEVFLIIMMALGILAFILSFQGCATTTTEHGPAAVQCSDRGMSYTAESQSILPFPMLVYSDLPAELHGPPQGRQSLACIGVYMQCENHGTTTRCWCSDTRVVR